MGQWRRISGFTLVELLVVVVILGVLISLAVLSSNNSHISRELGDEAQRIAAVIGVLADEAVLENLEYGLLISDQGYRVLSYDEIEDRWLEGGRSKEHKLPEWMRLDFELDGTPLQLAASVAVESTEGELSHGEDDKKERAHDLQPQLLVLSSGELSPFSLRVYEHHHEINAWVVSSDGFQLPQVAPAVDRQ